MKKKIAFLNGQDPYDQRGFSGTTTQIIKQLDRFYDVEWVNPSTYLSRGLTRLFHKQQDGRFQLSTAPLFVRKIVARRFRKLLKQNDFDCVFNMAMAWPLIDYNLNIPIITFMDATTKLMMGNYYHVSNLPQSIIKMTNLHEQNVFDKSDVIIVPTQWAKNSAINDYHTHPDKIKIIPIAPNVSFTPKIRSINSSIKNINLLFIGVNRESKGFDIVLDTMNQLNKIDSEYSYHLDVIGLTDQKSNYITYHGFLDKNNTEDRQKFDQLMTHAHLFFVPSRFESFGLVFIEASGAGLPVISSLVGGIPESIINNKTGLLLPFEARGIDYAKAIVDLINDPVLYHQFSINGIESVKKRCSWENFGDKIKQIIDSRLEDELR